MKSQIPVSNTVKAVPHHASHVQIRPNVSLAFPTFSTTTTPVHRPALQVITLTPHPSSANPASAHAAHVAAKQAASPARKDSGTAAAVQIAALMVISATLSIPSVRFATAPASRVSVRLPHALLATHR